MREINSNKEISKSGVAKLVKEDGNIDYSGSFKSFHGRGNSSWLGEKNRIVLNSKRIPVC